jgi:hypothetical protein
MSPPTHQRVRVHTYDRHAAGNPVCVAWIVSLLLPRIVNKAKGESRPMSAFIYNVTFDAKQPRTLGRFWSEVTGYRMVDEHDGIVRLRAPDHRGVRHILFFKVDDPTPGKNRMHVDLAARQPELEIQRLLDLGATLVDQPRNGKPLWREGNGHRWVVLKDPEGNEFCIG